MLFCEIPRSFECLSPSNFRTQGSFIQINSGKIFERDLHLSDSVAKSSKQKPSVSETDRALQCLSVFRQWYMSVREKRIAAFNAKERNYSHVFILL